MTKLINYIVVFISLLLLSSCSKEEAILVMVDFETSIINDDYSAPVYVGIYNKTKGADTYLWTFEGGNPETSTSKNPGTITYNQGGTYTIKLKASNQDEEFDEKEVTINLNDELTANFNIEIIDNNFPPLEVALTNTSTGADDYSWTFQNGNPETSDIENPENVVFNEPGDYLITLEVNNSTGESLNKQETITVAPHLETDFDYEISFNDEDLQVPVTLTMVNNSISATDYSWTFTGGTPETSTEENPIVIYNTPGTYSFSLEATNGKETQTITKEITVVANTNLRIFENLEIGINTAHNNNVKAAFFSTTTGELLTKNLVTEENGASIDICFFGLNQNFINNKFISPDEVQTTVFDAIPNATHTKFINFLENCNCSASMTVDEFDNMSDDTLLNNLTIEETSEGLQSFDNTVNPRIILFETGDGRKGAIKITNFVENGQDSYITINVKVEKE